jgi:hypothetical protein
MDNVITTHTPAPCHSRLPWRSSQSPSQSCLYHVHQKCIIIKHDMVISAVAQNDWSTCWAANNLLAHSNIVVQIQSIWRAYTQLMPVNPQFTVAASIRPFLPPRGRSADTPPHQSVYIQYTCNMFTMDGTYAGPTECATHDNTLLTTHKTQEGRAFCIH